MTHTPAPWGWTIHDSSAATLHGADCMLDHVLTVSPCKHCRGEEWEWGACTNPTQANAAFIIKAVNSHEALVKALQLAEAVLNIQAYQEARPIEALAPIRKALADAGASYLGFGDVGTASPCGGKDQK